MITDRASLMTIRFYRPEKGPAMSLNLHPGHVVRIDRPGESPPADPESAYRVVVDVDESAAEATLRELDDEDETNLSTEPLSVLTITGHV